MERGPTGPKISDDLVIWDDNRISRQRDLYQFDLRTWQEARLWETSDVEGYSVQNGHQVAYSREYGELPSGFVLVNLVSQQETLLDDAIILPGYSDMGERYVVWSANTEEPGTEGRDVLFHDLESGITNVVESSLAGYQHFVSVSGEWVVWMEGTGGSFPPWRLVAHNLATSEDRLVHDGNGFASIGLIHRNLVFFSTTAFIPQPQSDYPHDLALYDMDSGLTRRVTTVPSGLGAAGIFFPHLLVVDVVDLSNRIAELYVANLVELGHCRREWAPDRRRRGPGSAASLK